MRYTGWPLNPNTHCESLASSLSQAGGAGSTGFQRVLDIVPTKVRLSERGRIAYSNAMVMCVRRSSLPLIVRHLGQRVCLLPSSGPGSRDTGCHGQPAVRLAGLQQPASPSMLAPSLCSAQVHERQPLFVGSKWEVECE